MGRDDEASGLSPLAAAVNVNSPLLSPFAALRPRPEWAPEVAARPYDVVTFDEAKQGGSGKPWSFLHVSRAEIDLPSGTDPHAPEVYKRASRALEEMIEAGVLVREAEPCFYAYRMSAGDHIQTGIAGAGSIAAYTENRIRRHEHTRPDKELDRTRQIEAVGAHTGPVLAVHAPDPQLASVLAATTATPPIADARTDDGTRHQIWRIGDRDAVAAIAQVFSAMPAIWIADGHHRSAAAARVAEARHDAGGRFLLVSFPTDEVRILDYNRVVRDLNGSDEAAFLAAVREHFAVTPTGGAFRPERPGVFGLCLRSGWSRLELKQPPSPTASPVERLDVSLLNDRLLSPVLGITDPRTNPRIDFVGGGRGLSALEERVKSRDWAVAFALHPTRLADLIAVADAGLVMPPKSTWFEPKLADGLLSLPLSD